MSARESRRRDDQAADAAGGVSSSSTRGDATAGEAMPHDNWKAKLGYLGAYFGYSCMSPYYAVLFSDKGFGPANVGLLSAVMPACLVLLLPPMTYLSDRFKIGVKLSCAAIAVSIVTVLVMTTAETKLVVASAAVLHFICSTPIYPFLDHHTMAMLPEAHKTRWGESRVFGAYGWGIGAPLATQIFGRVGWPYVALQYAGGHACVAYTMTTTRIATSASTTLRYVEVWVFLLRHRRMFNFLVCVCFMGAGYVLIATFLFLFLKELGAPDVLLGISITTTVLVEIPLFQRSKQLHQRFTDRQLFSAAVVGWIVRVVGYSLLTNPWMVLLLEPLHGFTFGLMWLSGVNLLNSSFPQELAASAFGFLHASAFGIGPIVGNVVGGVLYEAYGARMMFRFAAAVMAVMLVGFQVSEMYFARKFAPQSLSRSHQQSPSSAGGGVESPRHSEAMEVLPGGSFAVASTPTAAAATSSAAAVYEAKMFDIEAA